jgi:hypothetical protein
MKGHNIMTFMTIFAVFGLFFSCTDFFSTSLAPWAARDPSSLIPPVTMENVNDLIASSENNPDMSFEILVKIQEALENADPGAASSLQAAALEAAANASGFGQTLLNKASDISQLMEDKDNAKGLVIDAINDMPNLKETGELLTAILPDPSTPEFADFIAKADADDLATAAAVLLASTAKDNLDSEDFLTTFDPSAPDLPPSATLAIELAKAAAQKYEENESAGRLQDILEGLNLV